MRGNQVYRYSGVLLSFLAFSLVSGCAATNEDANAHAASKTAKVTSEEPHHGKAFKVGVLLPSETEPAISLLRSAMREMAQTNNLQLNFEIAQPQQSSAPIERLRSQNVDALLLCARNPEDAALLVRPLGDAGIPVVVLIREPQHEEQKETTKKEGEQEQAGEKGAKPLPKLLPGVVAEVAPRAPRIGRTTSERLSFMLHSKGGIVLIAAKLDTATGAAWNDLRAFLHQCPLLHVLETRSGSLPPAEGLKMIAKHGGKLNAIICDDENTLRPLAEVCLQKKHADVALLAFDAGRETLMTVQNTAPNSFQNAVVQKIGLSVPADTPGKLAVQIVAATLRGEKPRPYVWADPVSVPITTPPLLIPPPSRSSIKPTARSTVRSFKQGEKTR